MATPKQITINDLSKDEKLTISRIDDGFGVDSLQVEKRYNYLDVNGDSIALLGTGRVTGLVAIVNVPANVLAALQTINDYMYNLALAQEGME